jgi:hypothetical protein
MAGNQSKPKPGDEVERGVPSWLGRGGAIVFGFQRPNRSPHDVQPPLATIAEIRPACLTDEMRGSLPGQAPPPNQNSMGEF